MERFIVVADTNGKVLRQHPAYEMVFDTVFTDDGRLVAYGVGTLPVKELWWRVESVENKRGSCAITSMTVTDKDIRLSVVIVRYEVAGI